MHQFKMLAKKINDNEDRKNDNNDIDNRQKTKRKKIFK